MYPNFVHSFLLSWFYCSLVVMYYCFLIIILFINIVFNWGNILVTSELIQYSSILVTATGSTICCLYHRHEISRMLWFNGYGFYQYPEPLSPEQTKILLQAEQEKKYICIGFSIYVYFGGTVAIILVPLIMLYQADFQFQMNTSGTVNKFYPVPIEYPFWNSNFLGYFIAGNILQYICFVIVTNTVLGTAVGYYCLVIALKNQFTVLALSIKNISSRANIMSQNFSSLLLKKESKSNEISSYFTDDTSHSSVFFQHCLNVCLKENILHHKVLIE